MDMYSNSTQVNFRVFPGQVNIYRVNPGVLIIS